MEGEAATIKNKLQRVGEELETERFKAKEFEEAAKRAEKVNQDYATRIKILEQDLRQAKEDKESAGCCGL